MNFLKKTMAAAAISVLSLGATSQAAIPQALLDGAFPNSEVVVLIDLSSAENPESYLSLLPLKEAIDAMSESAESTADPSNPEAQKAVAALKAANEAGIMDKIQAISLSMTDLANAAAGGEPTTRMIISGGFTTADFTSTYTAMGMELPSPGLVIEWPNPDPEQASTFVNHPADGFMIMSTSAATAATTLDGSANGVIRHAAPVIQSTTSDLVIAFQMDQLRAQAQQMGPMAQMAAPILKASAASLSTMPGNPPSLNLLLQYEDAQSLSIAKQFAETMIQGQLAGMKQQREALTQQGVTSSPVHERIALIESLEIKEVDQSLLVKLPYPITDDLRMLRQQMKDGMMKAIQQGGMLP